MAPSTDPKFIELSWVSPPPGSVPSTSLPLTFLDIPWLLLPPGQPLFFYDLPISSAEFMQTVLPILKNSLSVTLRHFFPFAGKLVVPPKPTKPRIEYTEGDSVLLTVAKSVGGGPGGDFSYLSSDGPRNFHHLHCLVPKLPLSEKSKSEECEKYPLLAIQITLFPSSGICMGFTLRPVVGDGRTFDNFLKMWASVNVSTRDKLSISGDDLKFLASHERSLIHDRDELEAAFLKQWWNLEGSLHLMATFSNYHEQVRSTFVLGPPEMDKIKKWILVHSKSSCGSRQMLLSPYVVTCAFVWVCWVKANWPVNETGKEEAHNFGFIAGGMTRLDYPVPASYVGNCVAFGRLEASREDLTGEKGIVNAAQVIGSTIKKLNGNVLGDAQSWISDWKTMFESELHVTVTGSPKLKFYNLDFGWGRVRKIEVTIDETRAISLCESRDMVGGIEIGLTLPKSTMERFNSLFKKGVNNLV